jgi:hypothetical protein
MKGSMNIEPKRARRFVEPLILHCDEQFPRECQNCGRQYEDFEDYVGTTTPIGTVCWDAEIVNGVEKLLDDLVGTLSMANCPCGTTLSIGCLDSESDHYRWLLAALHADAEDNGVTVVAVMDALRVIVRSAVQGSRQ